jgi:hypothetical protein
MVRFAVAEFRDLQHLESSVDPCHRDPVALFRSFSRFR